MTCHSFKNNLTEWLQKQWSDDKTLPDDFIERLNTHAQTCSPCSNLLAEAQAVAQLRSQTPTPSPDLADRIWKNLTDAIQDQKPKPRKASTFRIASLAATAAAAVTAIVFTAFLLISRSHSDEVWVRFSIEAPLANQVHVVGDWNEWDPAAHPLSDDDGDGVWEAEIALSPRKEYRYQFYIDNKTWLPDPRVPLKVDDGFGGQNSILRI